MYMKIENNDVLTLEDNKEYVVVSNIIYENKKYYYLMELNNLQNVLFCYEDNGDLVEVNDEKLLEKLLVKFYVTKLNIK